jgi:ubiquinone/menaquinone biosynthesis C-methylase UbiE
MSKQIQLNDYKQQIADLYNRRSDNYDDSQWHQQITHRLVEYAQISPGQHVLDIATGTGHVAIEVAQIVGSLGRVVGVDIAEGMLNQARRKNVALNLSNLEFQLADAETLDFPDSSFDRILCAHAFPWIVNMEGALRQWMRFLKPGGLVGIHTPADTAYVADVVLQKLFAEYGVKLAGSLPIGTVERLQNLLHNAGFTAVEIKTVTEERRSSLFF